MYQFDNEKVFGMIGNLGLLEPDKPTGPVYTEFSTCQLCLDTADTRNPRHS